MSDAASRQALLHRLMTGVAVQAALLAQPPEARAALRSHLVSLGLDGRELLRRFDTAMSEPPMDAEGLREAWQALTPAQRLLLAELGRGDRVAMARGPTFAATMARGLVAWTGLPGARRPVLTERGAQLLEGGPQPVRRGPRPKPGRRSATRRAGRAGS